MIENKKLIHSFIGIMKRILIINLLLATCYLLFVSCDGNFIIRQLTDPLFDKTLTVINGTGSGTYKIGEEVTITANTPPAGQQFLYWSTDKGGTFAAINSHTTTFTIPKNDVTVTANFGTPPVPSSDKAITVFSFSSPPAVGIINEGAKTIGVTVPFGTTVTALTPTVTHTGVSYTPTGAVDFTNPVIFTVTAEDTTTEDYTVTVTVAAADAKAITSFTINNVSGVINEAAKTINLLLPYGSSVTALTPSVTHTGASYSPTGSVNFSSPVNFTVTAADNSTAVYTVTVTVAVLESIAVTTPPDKTTYLIGDTLDITGLEVTATYTDGETSIVTINASHLSGFDSVTAGTKTVTVTYEGKTATFTVTVSAVSTFTVTFDNEGTTHHTINNVTNGSTITAPTLPTKTDYIFQGWYKEAAGTTKWDFAADTVTASITLYARWSHTENGPYRVGDRGPGGGIIFYVADEQGGNPSSFALQGFVNQSGGTYMAKYLEAAPADLPILDWATHLSSPAFNHVPGLSTHSSDELDRAIGRGRMNTALILATDAAAPAASYCVNYKPTVNGTTYSDWFLPSLNELNQLYLNRSTAGLETGTYWSSSQNGPNHAWMQNFNTGGISGEGKGLSYSVRPIRAFGDGPAFAECATHNWGWTEAPVGTWTEACTICGLPSGQVITDLYKDDYYETWGGDLDGRSVEINGTEYISSYPVGQGGGYIKLTINFIEPIINDNPSTMTEYPYGFRFNLTITENTSILTAWGDIPSLPVGGGEGLEGNAYLYISTDKNRIVSAGGFVYTKQP